MDMQELYEFIKLIMAMGTEEKKALLLMSGAMVDLVESR